MDIKALYKETDIRPNILSVIHDFRYVKGGSVGGTTLHLMDIISSAIPYDDIYSAMCNKKNDFRSLSKFKTTESVLYHIHQSCLSKDNLMML